jgi:iron-sulfur cluster assembly protein
MSDQMATPAEQTAVREPPKGIIYVTDKAANHVKVFAEREGKLGYGIRVSVKGGGCSGLSYVLGLDAQSKPGDKVIEQNGINIYVDAKSLLFLAGTTLDFTDGLNGKGFVFHNPQAKSSCGCGYSFST